MDAKTAFELYLAKNKPELLSASNLEWMVFTKEPEPEKELERKKCQMQNLMSGGKQGKEINLLLIYFNFKNGTKFRCFYTWAME